MDQCHEKWKANAHFIANVSAERRHFHLAYTAHISWNQYIYRPRYLFFCNILSTGVHLQVDVAPYAEVICPPKGRLFS